MKTLILVAIQALVSLFLPGARVLEQLNTEMIFNLYGKKFEADFFFKIHWRGRMLVFHIEFQKAKDAEIARRMWIYNTLMDIQCDLYVYSLLIYLMKESGLVGSPYVRQIPEISDEKELGHQGFGFQVFKLFEDLDPALLFTPEFQDLLPILTLTRGGQNRETVDRMITEIQARGLSRLLFLGLRFASLVLTDPEDLRYLKERSRMLKNIVQEDSIYRDTIELGIEQGRELAKAEMARLREQEVAEAARLREENAAEVARLREENAAEVARLREENAQIREEATRIHEDAARIHEETARIQLQIAQQATQAAILQAQQQALQAVQQVAINVIVTRFSELAGLAKVIIAAISDLERLQKLILEMNSISTQEQAQQFLLSLVMSQPMPSDA